MSESTIVSMRWDIWILLFIDHSLLNWLKPPSRFGKTDRVHPTCYSTMIYLFIYLFISLERFRASLDIRKHLRQRLQAARFPGSTGPRLSSPYLRVLVDITPFVEAHKLSQAISAAEAREKGLPSPRDVDLALYVGLAPMLASTSTQTATCRSGLIMMLIRIIQSLARFIVHTRARASRDWMISMRPDSRCHASSLNNTGAAGTYIAATRAQVWDETSSDPRRSSPMANQQQIFRRFAT